MHRVGVLVFDGVTLLDASGPAEVFRLADPQHRHYELMFISPHGGVRSLSGIEMAGTLAVSQVSSLDTLLVAGGEHLPQPKSDPTLIAAAQKPAERTARVASVCTAGISAGIDLALAIVEADLGAAISRAAAQEMVMFMRRPGGQSQFSTALQHLPAQSAPLRALVETVIADPSIPHTVASMATLAGVSVRHLNRLFNDELQVTPAKWLEKVRVDAARAYILDGHSITLSAQLAGFGSDETLRRAFVRHLNTTPTAFRERFSSTRPVGAQERCHPY